MKLEISKERIIGNILAGVCTIYEDLPVYPQYQKAYCKRPIVRTYSQLSVAERFTE